MSSDFVQKVAEADVVLKGLREDLAAHADELRESGETALAVLEQVEHLQALIGAMPRLEPSGANEEISFEVIEDELRPAGRIQAALGNLIGRLGLGSDVDGQIQVQVITKRKFKLDQSRPPGSPAEVIEHMVTVDKVERQPVSRGFRYVRRQVVQRVPISLPAVPPRTAEQEALFRRQREIEGEVAEIGKFLGQAEKQVAEVRKESHDLEAQAAALRADVARFPRPPEVLRLSKIWEGSLRKISEDELPALEERSRKSCEELDLILSRIHKVHPERSP